MKTLRYILSYVAAAVLAAAGWSCADSDTPADPGEVAVSFVPLLNAAYAGPADSRAVADTSAVDQIVVLAIAEGLNPVTTAIGWNEARRGIELHLIPHHDYTLLFWAQHAGAYSVEPNGTISANYVRLAAGGFATAEHLDAFSAVCRITTATAADYGTVTLRRAVAQLNFADKSSAPQRDTHTARIALDGIATAFNPITGQTVATGQAEFSFSDFPDEPLRIDGIDYHRLATLYLFPAANVGATYVLNADAHQMRRLSFENIPLEANHRTNILGALASPSDIDP